MKNIAIKILVISVIISIIIFTVSTIIIEIKHTGKNDSPVISSDSPIEVTDKLGHNYIVIEIEHSGNKHEFIVNQNCPSLDLEHWPDCKYCKEHEKLYKSIY